MFQPRAPSGRWRGEERGSWCGPIPPTLRSQKAGHRGLICRRAASKVHSAQHVESPVLRRPCSGPGRPAGLRLHLPAARCRLPAAPATPGHLGPAANLRPRAGGLAGESASPGNVRGAQAGVAEGKFVPISCLRSSELLSSDLVLFPLINTSLALSPCRSDVYSTAQTVSSTPGWG